MKGYRRYLESLNAYARQFVQPASRPDVDAVTGIPPTVAIEQRASRGGRKSTVATLTEVYPFLRLLYVKLGVQFCPDCQIPVQPLTLDGMVDAVTAAYRNQTVSLFAPLVVARKGHYRELAEWAGREGPLAPARGRRALVPTAKWPKLARFKVHDIELPLGELRITRGSEPALRALLAIGLEQGKGIVQAQSLDWAPRTATSRNHSLRAAPAPIAARAMRTRTRSCSPTTARAAGARSCFGTGQVLEDFDAEQTGEEGAWEEVRAST